MNNEPDDPHIHPLTIISARYGGIYEGAPYLAFNLYPEDIHPHAHGQDDDCVDYYLDAPNHHIIIGKGPTPDLATLDLQRQLNDL